MVQNCIQIVTAGINPAANEVAPFAVSLNTADNFANQVDLLLVEFNIIQL